MQHSTIGASSCERWWSCPGSVALVATQPKPPPSPYAEEGTAAHELAERCLREGVAPSDLVGQAAENGYEFTEEMAEAVVVYTSTIIQDLSDAGLRRSDLNIEKKFHLDWIDKNAFGTNDCSFGEPFGVLRVYDYKHGAGVPVDVIGNKQMQYYALGAAEQGDYTHIEMIIVQPRAMHPEGTVRRWLITIDELREFEMGLAAAVERTQHECPKLKDGKHCRFCPALAACPKILARTQEVAQMDFATATQPVSPEEMDNVLLGKILKSLDIFDAWVKAVNANAQQRAEQGQKIPGYKLVNKRANRKWVDVDDVISRFETTCGEEIFTKKIKTPAQLEKVIANEYGCKAKEAKEMVSLYAETPDAGVTLVAESDKRMEIAPPAQTDFEPVVKQLF